MKAYLLNFNHNLKKYLCIIFYKITMIKSKSKSALKGKITLSTIVFFKKKKNSSLFTRTWNV